MNEHHATSGGSAGVRAARIGVLFLGLLLTAACGKQQQGAATPVAGAAENTPVTLVLGDQVKYLRTRAEISGAFEGTPYKIEWANFQGAAPLFEAMRSGDVDTAVAGDTPALAAAAGNAPFRIIAAGVASSGHNVALLVPPDSPYKTVADLKGHQVVVSSARGSIAHYLLFAALKEAGLSIDDVTTSFMPPSDAAAAFDAHRIDAWATFGTYQVMAEHRGARVLRDGEGLYSGIGLIGASEKALASPAKRVALADMLQRLKRATQWCNDHPQEYAEAFSKSTGLPLDVVTTLIERDRPHFQPVDAKVIATLQQIADTFYHAGLFPKTVDVGSIVEPGLMAADSDSALHTK